MMEEVELSELEERFLEGCYDEALTRRRMRQVVLFAMIFALLLVGVTWFTRSWPLAVGVGLLYIGITTWEKLGYGRGVLVYKAIIRKLKARLDQQSA